MTCRELISFFLLQDDGDATRTFLHSCAQRLGLQRLLSTIAMRVILSAMMVKGENSRLLSVTKSHRSGPDQPRGFDPSCRYQSAQPQASYMSKRFKL
jgi:hypothetical protein